MPDGVLDHHLAGLGATLEVDGDPVGDRALLGIQVVGAELLVLHTLHLFAQCVDTGVGRNIVLVVGCREPAVNERHGDHVLDAVVAVGGVVERPFLVDDADGRLVGADHDPLDLVKPVLDLRVQLHGALYRRLGMELGGERDLEQHVLHDVRAVRPLKLELVALEQDVVEAPGLGREHRGIAHLAFHGDERQAHCAAGRITRRPRFARPGVGSMPVGAQRLAVDPRLRHRVDDLVAVAAQHACHHRRAGQLHQDHVVEPHPVEAVLQGHHALDLVSLDHGGEDVADDQGLLAACHCGARQPVGGGEDAAEVVRGVAPFRGQPGVVEVQPADHGADVEGRLYRIELELRAGHLGAVGHHRPGHDRAEHLGARRIGQGLEPAAQSVRQTQARGVVRLLAGDVVVESVLGDVDEDSVGIGADVGDVCGHISCLKIEPQRRKERGEKLRISSANLCALCVSAVGRLSKCACPEGPT